jgi:hypothetical protein
MERFEEFCEKKKKGNHDVKFYVKCIKKSKELIEGRVYTTSRIKVTTHGVYVSLEEISDKQYDASNFEGVEIKKIGISINPVEMRFEVESKPNTFSCIVMDKNLKPVSFLDNKTQYWNNNEAFYYADFDYGQLGSFFDNRLKFINLYKIISTDIFNEEFHMFLIDTITIEDIKAFMNNIYSVDYKQIFLTNYYDMLNKKD